ncbi:hypothetical protein [Bradyrhizobium sp. CCBAU 45321]|uniref:hypothetical protein n=1 Tax=Bradyrhizobium sp. CCBAU 45321 TaxID=1641878 RepID=UPI0023037DED|nr:hypothetical protein [Bradyrhizobium sp. CCBAU 45321]
MKLFGFGARVLRMRPGRIRRSLSPTLTQGLPTIKIAHGAEDAFDSIGQNAKRGTRPD